MHVHKGRMGMYVLWHGECAAPACMDGRDAQGICVLAVCDIPTVIKEAPLLTVTMETKRQSPASGRVD